jgi:hypothetical protein
MASCLETVYSKTSTASTAPIGSIIIPSQRKILAILMLGLTISSIGTITLGSVTVTMAPNKNAISHAMPIAKCAVGAATIQVIRVPTVHKFRAVLPWPLKSLH